MKQVIQSFKPREPSVTNKPVAKSYGPDGRAVGASELAHDRCERAAEAARVSAAHVTRDKPLISVCICTYQRRRQLNQLLHCLNQQSTNGLFNFAIVVVDNDANQSARSLVELWAERMSIPVAYGVEPRQNIALARNAAVAMATGRLLAFVDDDEEPSKDWLRKLYEVLIEYDVDGVLGPVVPRFDECAPAWAVKGGVFRRKTFETGKVIDWLAVGIGNALVKREVLLELSGPFRPEFGAGGEDRDLFRRAISRGRVFVWSAEAVCHEPVPPERTRVGFQLRRALLRGKMALRGSGRSWRGILKSAIAVPLYAVALPVCLIMGSHVFVTCLVRAFDHVGKLLASCGIDLVGDKYIT
jgi:succinoglycan biosynthesis protein ExoM